MEKSLKYGAHIINDVSGLNYDPNTLKILRNKKTPFIIHHMQGNPKTMQIKPSYKNVLLDIYDFFQKKILELKANGIKHRNIILDPGIGFGKNDNHNIKIFKDLALFHYLKSHILIGASRKSMIGRITNTKVSERLPGSLSLAIASIEKGVKFLRVHDIKETKQALTLWNKINYS